LDIDSTCSICLESYRRQVVTKCGHSFCAHCISSVLRGKPPAGNRAPCPFCRADVLMEDLVFRATGETLISASVTPTTAITAPVRGAWFGDERHIPHLDAEMLDFEAAEVLTPDVWHVADVYWFDCHATLLAPKTGKFEVSFRVKRLPAMSFDAELIMMIDDVEIRRANLRSELRPSAAWQMVHVGSVDLQAPREIRVNMQAVDQTWLKRGLLINCAVLLPAGAELAFPFHYDSSGLWMVQWDGESPARPARRPITVIEGYYELLGGAYQMEDTQPITIQWADGSVQTFVSFDGTTVTWSTTNLDYPMMFWERRETLPKSSKARWQWSMRSLLWSSRVPAG